jgi:hypothetical protein
MIDSLAKAALAAGALLATTPAMAQIATSAGVEATTDENRRGISWSEGRASIAGDATVSGYGLDLTARVAALRGSDRHGGADAVADLTLGSGWDVGAVRLRAQGTAHIFGGARGNMDYAELGGSASYTYGPADLTAGAIWAPEQRAIGGSNLYLYANASAGLPGTPLTAIAGLGHSSGTVSDPVRAQRLRPGGDYTDWRLGVEYRRDRLTLGVDYVGTDVTRADAFGAFADAGHAGDRLLGRVRFDF